MDYSPSLLSVPHPKPLLLSNNKTTFQANRTELDLSEQEITKKYITEIAKNYLTLGFFDITSEFENGLKISVSIFFGEGESFAKSKRESLIKSFTMRQKEYEKTTETFQITTFDQAVLDGMIIHPNVSSLKEKKYVIWLNGFQESFENKAIRAAEYANKANASIVLFNFRGTGNSLKIAKCSNDFIKDTLSIIDFLMVQKKINPENIIVHGFSLSSGIAAQIAHLRKIKCINDRGYLKFSSIAKNNIQQEFKGAGAPASTLIKKAGFEFNTKKLYLDKDKAKVKTLAERTFVIFHSNDDTIKLKGSFHLLANCQVPFHSIINLNDYHSKLLTKENIENFYTEMSKWYELEHCSESQKMLKKNHLYNLENHVTLLSRNVSKEIENQERKFENPNYFTFSGETTEDIRQNLYKLDELNEHLYTDAHTVSFLIFPDVMRQLSKFIHDKREEGAIETNTNKFILET